MGNIVEDLVRGWTKTLEEVIPLEAKVRDLVNANKGPVAEGAIFIDKCNELLEKLFPILENMQTQKGYTADLVIEGTGIVEELDGLVKDMRNYTAN